MPSGAEPTPPGVMCFPTNQREVGLVLADFAHPVSCVFSGNTCSEAIARDLSLVCCWVRKLMSPLLNLGGVLS